MVSTHFMNKSINVMSDLGTNLRKSCSCSSILVSYKLEVFSVNTQNRVRDKDLVFT